MPEIAKFTCSETTLRTLKALVPITTGYSHKGNVSPYTGKEGQAVMCRSISSEKSLRLLP